MKKFSLFFVLFLFSIIISTDKISSEPLKTSDTDFLNTLPEVKKSRLNNDLEILFIKNDLPVTVIYATICYGKLYENSGNAGITDTLVRTLSISGTASYPGNTLNQKLESVGGEIHITAGWETIGIEIKVLSRHSGLAFNILGDILKNPVIGDDGVKSAKKLVIEKIRRGMDEPDETGVLKLREVIFGGSGYGAVPTAKSVNGLSSAGLKNLWNRIITGSNVNIAVSSSYEEKDISALAVKEMSAIPKGGREHYTVNKEKIMSDIKSSSGLIYLIPMELEQATIYTGTVAPEIKYAGNYALYLMNYILGGGSFNSRLMNDIRVKRGLAYSVYSLVRNRRDTGVFIAFAQTKNESAVQVLSLMQDNIKKICSEPVTAEELGWAKESVKNSYVFRFNTLDDLLGNFLEIEYNDLDSSYFRDYLGNINKVSASDIFNESGKMFNGGLVTVVVGSRKLEKELSLKGRVIVCEQGDSGRE